MSAWPEIATDGPLARLFADPRVSVAEMDPRTIDLDAGLFPEEAAAVERAVLTRRQQFAAGRILARRAWQRLGQAPVPLLSDERRVPIWPNGIVGTITHTHGWCAAAVARQREVMGLGADVEPTTPLEHNLWERICRPEERAFLAATPAPLAGLLAKGIFSAKESIYKALYPTVREFLDFQGMHVTLEATATAGRWRWTATLQIAWGAFEPGRRFKPGELQIGPDLISSAIIL
jgi:4'-phosphopantetheinyl transferase EntD